MLNVDTTPHWVDSSEELARLCEKWRGQKAVALDTEFMRSRTFYPQPALVQVGDGEHCYLIDNLAIENLEPLRELILDTSVTKIMHSCSEDLETLDRLLGAIPEPIFDTQIAAAMTGLGAGLGYAATVKTLINVELPKSETRSDWLQRPLSEAQKTYAALDVAWLPHVYAVLLKRLKESDRLAWLQEDCEQLVAAARNPQPPELYYQKVKGAWRLRGKQLAALQDLCAWREREARLRDVPRNHLLKEAVCLKLAQQLPEHPAAMAQPGLEGRSLREHGDTLQTIISRARERQDAPPSLPQPLTRRQGECLKALRQRVNEIAEREGLPAEILVRKKELEELLQASRPSLEGRLRGWRGDLVGAVLLEGVEAAREESESK
ncbi:ribonuclease D [Microbulbifer guangxiensis]|uniref:ribonuclease D n=1 Tax=Microbulbifer guangxiensis TaxID=2904249 RepID=UPI001F02BA06|nr:ribonuclease D [Microbulbifer guangxiensis]